MAGVVVSFGMDRFKHQALRDTHWLGKGVRQPWLLVLGIIGAAYLAVRLFGG